MSLSLKALIDLVGLDNIMVEPVADNLVEIKECSKKMKKAAENADLCQMTLLTTKLNPTLVMGDRGDIGLVVWIPRNKWPTKEQIAALENKDG
jgi:hypothetical protein